MRIKQFCVSGTKESETIVAHNAWGGQRGLLDEKSQDENFLKNENTFGGEKTLFPTPWWWTVPLSRLGDDRPHLNGASESPFLHDRGCNLYPASVSLCLCLSLTASLSPYLPLCSALPLCVYLSLPSLCLSDSLSPSNSLALWLGSLYLSVSLPSPTPLPNHCSI